MSFLRLSPVTASHRMAVVSSDPVRTCCPSGLKAKHLTGIRCLTDGSSKASWSEVMKSPASFARGCSDPGNRVSSPVNPFQITAEAWTPQAAVANCWPRGLNPTQVIHEKLSPKLWTLVPALTSQSPVPIGSPGRTSQATARARPSGSNVTE